MQPYGSVVALATVEPLAILLEMPVEVSLAFNDLDGLEKRLNQIISSDKNQKVLIVWEHKIAEQVMKNFLQHHGIKTTVPHWEDNDFDSIYIVQNNAQNQLSFRTEKEFFDKLPDQCPMH